MAEGLGSHTLIYSDICNMCSHKVSLRLAVSQSQKVERAWRNRGIVTCQAEILPFSLLLLFQRENTTKQKYFEGGARWRKSKMRRSPSFPQIHQKYIYTWNCSYRTPTECWQKTSDLPKGKKIPTYLGRAKEKRNNRDKRIGTGPAPAGGSREGGKVSTH